MAVDIVESLNITDPFVNTQLHGTLHRDNLTRRMVVFTNDYPAHPGDKILYNGVMYRCDETFDTQYHASRGKKLFIIPHYRSHKVVCTMKELDSTPTAQELFEMYRDYALGKVNYRIQERGHNRYRLTKRPR